MSAETHVDEHAVEAVADEPTGRRGWIAVALVVVVLLGAIGAVLVLHQRQDQAVRAEAARADAARAAGELIPKVLSYSHETLDRDLAAAADSVTGRFRDDYTELQRSVVRSSAQQNLISTRTTVAGVGVVRGDEQEVVVLAFINQLTTSKQQATPRIEGARVRVTLRKTDDRWLVSALDTV